MVHILVNRITIICILLILNSVLSEDEGICKNDPCRKLSKCGYAIEKIDDGEASALVNCGHPDDDEPSYCCPPIAKHEEQTFTGDSYEIAKQYCDQIANRFIKHILMPNGIEITVNDCQLKDVPVIINGEVTKKGEFPHMALLGYVNKSDANAISWQCGGTLISNRFVLTAKHCYSQNPKDLLPGEDGEVENNCNRDNDQFHFFRCPVSKVLLGAHDYKSTEGSDLRQMYDVAKFFVYDTERDLAYNDIALIQLDREVEFSPHIYPACLNIEDSYDLPKYTISGWGLFHQSEPPSSVMLKGVVEWYNDEFCVEKYSDIQHGYLDGGVDPDSQICAGTKSLKNVTQSYDYCNGDSGGPLQYYNGNCSYTVIGIVSTALATCNTIGFPSIYTRVYWYVDWIVNIIWKN